MSSLPGYTLPEQPFWSFDKVVHIIEFGLFGLLVYRAFRFPRPFWKPYLATVIAGTLYAASDEFHQLFVPGRNGDIRDFAVDVLGVILFAGISARLHRVRSAGGVDDAMHTLTE